jgi:hypothetical protein
VRGVDVGVAQPGGLDPHQQLAGAGLRDRDVLQFERLVEAGDDGGFHRVPLSWSGPG